MSTLYYIADVMDYDRLLENIQKNGGMIYCRANAFASLTGVRVYASDSEVFNWFYLSQGWYVYDGGNGHHTKVINRVLNWGDI